IIVLHFVSLIKLPITPMSLGFHSFLITAFLYFTANTACRQIWWYVLAMILVLFTMYRAYGSYFRPLACQRVETRFYNMNRCYASLPHHLPLLFIERRVGDSGFI